MQKVPQVDLRADRHTPFQVTLLFNGLDLTSAGMHAQVRLTPDTGGTPLIDLPLVTDGSRGVRLMNVTTTAGVSTSEVRVQAGQSDIEALPEAADKSRRAVFAWDIQIDPVGAGINQVYARGAFYVDPGVTQ